jgi:GT2 family glycosyltransferase
MTTADLTASIVTAPQVTTTPVVTFVVPVKNDAERLALALGALRANDLPPHRMEIIVADNGSSDDSVEVARAHGARVLVHPELTVAQLRNRAAAEASGDVLAFVDADHVITATWLIHAISDLQGPAVAAAGALCVPPSPGTWVQRMYGLLRGRSQGIADVPWLGSGNLVVWRWAFEQVGGFDESLHTCEDVDLCQRLRAANLRLIGDERLLSVHLGDPATLRALFTSERWRGRDNLRVSLQGGLSLRDLPGVLAPVLGVGFGSVAIVGVLLSPFWGGRSLVWSAIAIASFIALTTPRAVRMAIRGRLRDPLKWLQALIVAGTYDAGRAAALVVQSSYHRRGAPTGHAA